MLNWKYTKNIHFNRKILYFIFITICNNGNHISLNYGFVEAMALDVYLLLLSVIYDCIGNTPVLCYYLGPLFQNLKDLIDDSKPVHSMMTANQDLFVQNNRAWQLWGPNNQQFHKHLLCLGKGRHWTGHLYSFELCFYCSKWVYMVKFSLHWLITKTINLMLLVRVFALSSIYDFLFPFGYL